METQPEDEAEVSQQTLDFDQPQRGRVRVCARVNDWPTGQISS